MKNSCLILLALLTTSVSHSQKETLKFANADAPYHNVGQDSLAVKGYDVTEYFLGNTASKGSSEFQYKNQGVTYLFASEKNRSLFIENPEKYKPEFGGYCAYGLAMEVDGNGYPPGKYPVNPKTFKIIDDKLYLFYNESGYNFLKVWESNEKGNLEKANERWAIIHREK
ncbi:YHS domain-containing (seleno)protein [Flagellimonas allohymeniacidonis]|nr:YHS domain-containing (seleno)protein [Allomuricauda hymeniacidonis]